MHNFKKPQKSIADSLNEVGSGLKSPKKNFFANTKDRLAVLFDDYNDKASNDALHTLKPEWPINTCDDAATKVTKNENRKNANGLYNSDRLFVNKHWETLKDNNNGEIPYCPICGLNECEEMDHYVPRDEDKFPEYSTHLDNLIPLCHSCNHKKSNKFIGEDGERLYFNAYYDKLEYRDIIVATIELSTLDGLPQIVLSVNPKLSKMVAPDKYILSTIDDLNLMQRFNERAKLQLREEMTRLSVRAGQSWDIIREEMNKMATPIDGDPDIIKPTVMRAIAQSLDMEKWFNNLCP